MSARHRKGTRVAAWAVVAVLLAAPGTGAVTLSSPNGGEVIASGSPWDVEWERLPGESSFTVRYSLDGGLTWKVAARNVEAAPWTWRLPMLPRSRAGCLVSVVAYDGGGRRLDADRSDRPFTIQGAGQSDFSGPPRVVNGGFTYQEPPLDPDDVPPDPGETALRSATSYGGLECDNFLVLEIGTDPGGGTAAEELQLRVGDNRFTIHLRGEGHFLPGSTVWYDLPGSNPDAYRRIPPDDWDRLSLHNTFRDAIQIHRVLFVRSCETILDVTVDEWLGSNATRTFDFSIDSAWLKWGAVDSTRVTALFYASQDLGQTGSRKYVDDDVLWCSEFASHVLRKAGLTTPTGSIGVADLESWFMSNRRHHTREEVEALLYTPRPGDYMAIKDRTHSVLFRGWVGPWPDKPDFNGDSEFYTIEGNNGNAVRTGRWAWRDVNFVGGAQ